MYPALHRDVCSEHDYYNQYFLPLAPYTCNVMSHHLFLLSPSDTPLYSLTHQSTKPVASLSSPLAANLPTWSTSAFAGTLTALSGASSAPQHTTGGSVRMGGGQDRHVIQMIANASLDVIEDVMRKENTMCVLLYCLLYKCYMLLHLWQMMIQPFYRYFKAVDKFNEWTVSAFITPGSKRNYRLQLELFSFMLK